jgi:hypothetical protein
MNVIKPMTTFSIRILDKRVNVPMTYQVTATNAPAASQKAIDRAKRDCKLPHWDRSFVVLSCHPAEVVE